jgi:hypothetical protein
VKFIRDWLHIDRPAGVAPHPFERIELERSFDDAWAACIRGVEDVLGGVVRESDKIQGRIEATFGLVNSERLTCTLQTLDPLKTRVTIESRRGASPEPPASSQYVRALAQFLRANE